MTTEQTQRRLGADLLRQFMAGEITNEQFHRSFPRSKSDAALKAIFRGAWVTYSDLREYRLVGKEAPSEKVRAILERCQLFLTTDLPFEWPEPKISLLSGILNLFSFGSIARRNEKRLRELGEVDYWPFIRKSDYMDTLTHAPGNRAGRLGVIAFVLSRRIEHLLHALLSGPRRAIRERVAGCSGEFFS